MQRKRGFGFIVRVALTGLAALIVVAIAAVYLTPVDTYRGPIEEAGTAATGRAVDTALLDGLVRREILQPFDHRNLNTEVAVFGQVVATSENLGFEICRRLKRNWSEVFPGDWPKLEKIRIAETERNIFEVSADEIE